MPNLSEAEADAAVGAAHGLFTAEYGAIPPAVWQAIIAALSSILGGCIAPTPQSVKTQWNRVLVRARTRLELRAERVPDVSGVVAAIDGAVVKATDEQIGAFVSALRQSS